MTRHFLIDTDTASDDAVALVMAMHYPDVQIEAITIVAGNVPVDQGVQNALYTVELCQQAIPVHRGMPAPLTRPLNTAQFVHGQDGMGDIGLPLTGRSPASTEAIRVILNTIHQFAGDITLVALGPLTNIAVALRQDPSIALDPTIATRTYRGFVAIETASILCRGQFVVDHLHIMDHELNVDVVMEASREQFLRMGFDAVS